MPFRGNVVIVEKLRLDHWMQSRLQALELTSLESSYKLSESEASIGTENQTSYPVGTGF